MMFKDIKVGAYFFLEDCSIVFRKISDNGFHKAVGTTGYTVSFNGNDEVISCDRDGNKIVEYVGIHDIPAGAYFKYRDCKHTIWQKPFTSPYSDLAIAIKISKQLPYIGRMDTAKVYYVISEKQMIKETKDE